jgi:lipopolysaccharide biosynthesis glycosyltransferase
MMNHLIEPLKIFVGFDQREAVAYHTFCQSVIDHASKPVAFVPLALNTLHDYAETHTDGSNDFIYSRFLVPHLAGHRGIAIFCDGDMVVKSDIWTLIEHFDSKHAVSVVKHDYITKATTKYLGNKNEDYPRKNWSSVILWNCDHQSNKILTPTFIQNQTGAFLHRFSWLEDFQIGELPLTWNWLAEEYDPDQKHLDLIHFTLGTPCFSDYKHCDYSENWWQAQARSNSGIEK